MSHRIFNTFEQAWDATNKVHYTKVVGKVDIVSGGGLYVNGSALASAELGYIDGVTAGTVAASKALVANSAGCIKWTSVTPTFDDDGPWINMGSWNTGIDITSQTDHFVPIQVHLDSKTSVAKDIACARFRVDTEAANTLTAVGCLQLRHNLAHNIASSAILNASVNVSDAVTVGSGSLLGGYFSIEGSGAITKAGDNDCTPLVAVSNHTGGGVDNVFVAMMNGTGDTIDEIVKVVCEHGTATVGVDIEKTSNGTALTKGLYIKDATLGIETSLAAIGANGRIAKLYGSSAATAMEDGYGAVEIDLTLSGTVAGPYAAASSTWVNVTGASVTAGSNMVCVRNDGIYVTATGTPMASATAVIGGRLHYIADGGGNPGALYLWSTNIYSNALTAIFNVNTIADFAATTTKSGDSVAIPFIKLNDGTVYYVNAYTS
jgi:hypothetical protein